MNRLARAEAVMAEPAMRRRFTPGDANRALVLVRRVVADVVRRYARMLDLHETIDAAETAGDRTRFEIARDELVATAECLYACLEELELIGVEIRDFSRGIVDFPCLMGGREIALCWEHGESYVGSWHERGESFAQRRPLSHLESWELLAVGSSS